MSREILTNVGRATTRGKDHVLFIGAGLEVIGPFVPGGGVCRGGAGRQQPPLVVRSGDTSVSSSGTEPVVCQTKHGSNVIASPGLLSQILWILQSAIGCMATLLH